MRLGRAYIPLGAFLAVLTCFLLLKTRFWPTRRNVLLDYASSCFGTLAPSSAKPSPAARSSPIMVVIAAVSGDSSDKLQRESGLRAGDSRIVYVADQPPTQNGIGLPQNKGHEAMVYLTCLIDSYETLPEVMVFMHGHRTAWHNNALLRRSSSITVNKICMDYAK